MAFTATPMRPYDMVAPQDVPDPLDVEGVLVEQQLHEVALDIHPPAGPPLP